MVGMEYVGFSLLILVKQHDKKKPSLMLSGARTILTQKPNFPMGIKASRVFLHWNVWDSTNQNNPSQFRGIGPRMYVMGLF